MSNLPDQSLDLDSLSSAEMISKADAEHLYARKEARRDLDRLDGEVVSLRRMMVEAIANAAAESKALRETLAALPTNIGAQIDRCREEIRKEVNDGYPTRIENMKMETRIEGKIAETDKTLGKQIDALDKKLSAEIAELRSEQSKQWLKIVGPITGVIAIAMVVTWLLGTYGKLTGG